MMKSSFCVDVDASKLENEMVFYFTFNGINDNFFNCCDIRTYINAEITEKNLIDQ